MEVRVMMVGEGWDESGAAEIGTIKCDDDSSDIRADLVAMLDACGGVIYPTDRIVFKIEED